MVEIDGEGYAETQFSYELGYNDGNILQPGTTTTNTISLAPGSWDTGNWDSGSWDSQTLTTTRFKLSGTAENIALTFKGQSDFHSSVSMSGALVRYTVRRQMR